MSNNKSYGFHSCPVSILKHASALSDIISDVFNKSFDLGTFRFKSVKNGESCTNFLNLMISRFLTWLQTNTLLSCFNRIFERLVYKRMKSFIKEKNILWTSQYGLRQGHSTEHAILDIAFSCGVFVDLKKAFWYSWSQYPYSQTGLLQFSQVNQC